MNKIFWIILCFWLYLWSMNNDEDTNIVITEEIIMTDEDLETKLDHSYNLGISAGLNIAADYLLDLSADKFTIEGASDGSIFLRNVSIELKNKSVEKHPGTGDGVNE